MSNAIGRWTRWGGRLCKAAAIAACAVAMPAQAVIYNSQFDPVVFFGTARFDIASSCLATDGWKATNFSYFDGIVLHPSCGSALLLSSLVQHNPPEVDSLAFTGTGPFDVIGVFVQDGLLAGIDTFPVGPGTADPGTTFDGSFFLEFSSGNLPNASSILAVTLLESVCDGECFFVPVGDPATDVTFAVPEPGMPALLLAGLGMLLLVRGRRRRVEVR